MSAMRSAADEAHREDTRIRVHESHTRLHRLGRVTGGRISDTATTMSITAKTSTAIAFGPIPNGSWTQFRPRSSCGFRAVCLWCRAQGHREATEQRTRPISRPFVRKDPNYPPPVNGWSPSTIQGVVKREIYKGVLLWNKSRKRDDWGRKDPKRRPQSEWLRTDQPDLQIVSDDLWNRVASRRADTAGRTLRFEDGRMCGRPSPNGVQNLLAGLATCGVCGGGLGCETSPRKRGRIQSTCASGIDTPGRAEMRCDFHSRNERGGIESGRRACAHTRSC